MQLMSYFLMVVLDLGHCRVVAPWFSSGTKIAASILAWRLGSRNDTFNTYTKEDGTNTYMYTFPDHFKSSQVKLYF